MSGWGGARTPSAPAVVSGPGANSARTDGGVMNPNSPSYGEVADLESLQQAAPVAGSPGAQGAGQAAGGDPGLIPLDAESQAGLPVTAGAELGAGPGMEALGLPQSAAEERQADAQALGPQLRAMLVAAERPEATPSFKRYVRQVIANL